MKRLVTVALVGACLVAGISGSAPDRAEAAYANFTCTLLAPNTWCRHGVWHNYHSMGVEYYGAGSMTVCARVVKRQGGALYSKICGTNNAASYFGACNCGGLWNDIGHKGNVPHNLHGWGGY